MWITAIIGQPLAALLLFGLARYASTLIGKALPEGRIKRILFISWKV